MKLKVVGQQLLRCAIVLVSATLFVTVLAAGTADAQSTQRTNPCPNFSIQDVFDDPNGDWDRDGVRNSTELYNGLKPCLKDSSEFCASSPTMCYKVYTPHRPNHYTCSGGYWTWGGVNANPNGDWDRDGVSNYTEAINGANPCRRPCPQWTKIDLGLNPNGDWDGDRQTNAVEAWQGSNPCVSHYYQHTPRYTPAPTVQNTPLPHVDAPPTGYKCPHGFPYYHAPTGLCYVNPVS